MVSVEEQKTTSGPGSLHPTHSQPSAGRPAQRGRFYLRAFLWASELHVLS